VGVIGSAAGAAQAAPIPIQPAPDGCRSLPVDADPAIRGAIARSTYGVDGTGVTIGIMSTSFDSDPTAITRAADDVAAGLLPGSGNPCGRLDPVEVLPNVPGETTDEGRAMAQLVHGVAPGAHIVFAAAGDGTVAQAVAAVNALADAGADVIVDDMLLIEEPFFQESQLGVRIGELVDEGIVYLSAAGNENLVGALGYPSADLPIGSWSTARYRSTDCPAGVGEASGLVGPWDCMEFDPSGSGDATNTLTLEAATETVQASCEPTCQPTSLPLIMQWGEPQGAVAGSFAIVGNVPGELIGHGDSYLAGLAAQGITLSNNTAEALPVEVSIVRSRAGESGETYPAVGFIAKTDGAQTLLHAEYFESQGDDSVGPTIFGHNGSPAAITVAAAPFDVPTNVEDFSSFGPVNYYVSPATTTSAGETFVIPQRVSKPDITSVDYERTSFTESKLEYGPGQYLFPGTSAATPVAGAVIALGLQARPDITPAQARAALTSTATALPVQYRDFTAEQVTGAGLVDAEAFVAAVLALPTPDQAAVPAASGTPALAATGTDAALALWMSIVAILAGLTVARRRRLAPRELPANAHTVEKSNRKERHGFSRER
jgi:hypothetical protein